MPPRILWFLPLATLSFGVGYPVLCAGDNLEMPAPQLAASSQPLPQRGMHRNRVRQQFGDPQQQLPAVGMPPIIRWHYPDYTLYFEGDYVIHAVPDSVGPH